MIHVRRKERPKILKDKAEQWKKALQSAKTPEEKIAALNNYRRKSIKAALVGMFHGKCGYCESKITHVDYGHIEHYRPKSGPAGRPALAFAWSNLLLACGRCNGTEFKGDKFPGPDQDGPIINPCKDDPVSHFTFHYDPVAKLASVYGFTKRGQTTETLLGLNRPELREHRSKSVQKIIVLATFAATNAEAASLVQEAKAAHSEYSAFARTLT